MQEEILKQVQEIRLYKHVKDFIFDEKSCLCNETCLTDIAESLCCQAAQVFEGTRSLSQNGFCCQESCAVKTNEDTPVTVVSGTVTNGMVKQQLDVLIPSSSSCIAMHPTSSDVLTALLLALPPQTWFSIKDENLSQDISGLVSIDNLPTLLQEEVPLIYSTSLF